MAKARPIFGVEPGASFGAAAAAAIATRTSEVFEHSEGVLDTGDIDGVHDMRVATRRLRAALEVFAPCFPRKRHKRLLREVKRLAAALGERRDPDVAIERLQGLRERFDGADRAGIEALIADLRGDQRTGNERLAVVLAEVREGELERRLVELAEAARR